MGLYVELNETTESSEVVAPRVNADRRDSGTVGELNGSLAQNLAGPPVAST